MKLLLLFVALCAAVTPLQGHSHLRQLALGNTRNICADQTFSKKRGYRNFQVRPKSAQPKIVSSWTGITSGYCNKVTDRKLNFEHHNHRICAWLGDGWYDVVKVPEVIWPLVRMQPFVKRNKTCLQAGLPTQGQIKLRWVP